MQTILILDCAELYCSLEYNLKIMASKHHLEYTQYEDLYDWVITTSISNILHLTVKGHVRNLTRNDAYRMIYDEIGFDLEVKMAFFIDQQQIRFLKGETVKMLVTYRDVLIVRSF